MWFLCPEMLKRPTTLIYHTILLESHFFHVEETNIFSPFYVFANLTAGDSITVMMRNIFIPVKLGYGGSSIWDLWFCLSFSHLSNEHVMSFPMTGFSPSGCVCMHVCTQMCVPVNVCTHLYVGPFKKFGEALGTLLRKMFLNSWS